MDTENIPLLNNIIKLPPGERASFTAQVWFINKIYSLDIKWGTAIPIQLRDPQCGVFVPVRSYGQFGIRIHDSGKFLTKLVGTLSVFSNENVLKYFRGLYLTGLKDIISSYLVHKQVGILEANAYLDEISDYMKERTEPMLEKYGISLLTFHVNDISVQEEDPAVTKLREALVKRAETNIIGYHYRKERSLDTLEGGGYPADTKSCPECKTPLPAKNLKFCPECGTALIRKCPRCDTVMEGNPKFCSECGERLS